LALRRITEDVFAVCSGKQEGITLHHRYLHRKGKVRQAIIAHMLPARAAAHLRALLRQRVT
jgi:hypothetical protein